MIMILMFFTFPPARHRHALRDSDETGGEIRQNLYTFKSIKAIRFYNSILLC